MIKTITALQVQKNNQERVSVFLDGEYAFGVTLMVAAGLKKGQVLSSAEIQDLQYEDERNRAYEQAVRYLGYRPRSRAEVERYLGDKGYDPEVVAHAMERLARRNYVDDEAFARFWLENRERFRPRGARALRYELREKGISDHVVDATLSELDEDASAWAALEPKLHGWRALDWQAFQKKAMGYLSRRGFGYGTARQACQRAWAVMHGSEPEDE
jgi:regulatory protein